jgi:hypothetical protein
MLRWSDDTGPHVRRSSHDRIPSLTEAVAAAYPRYDVATPEHWPLDPYLNGPLGPGLRRLHAVQRPSVPHVPDLLPRATVTNASCQTRNPRL